MRDEIILRMKKIYITVKLFKMNQSYFGIL